MCRFAAFLFAAFLLVAGCGGSADAPEADAPEPSSPGLSADELEHGIGPIQEVDLAATVEAELAAEGQAIFEMKCSACHKMEDRYVGPPLGDIFGHRSPEYLMNMILNPAGMLEKHPEAKALLAQYMTPMPNQSLTEHEARAVVEYLRQVHEAAQSPSAP